MAASCGAKDTFGASAGKQIYESDETQLARQLKMTVENVAA
jgi:hypothetical protein